MMASGSSGFAARTVSIKPARPERNMLGSVLPQSLIPIITVAKSAPDLRIALPISRP